MNSGHLALAVTAMLVLAGCAPGTAESGAEGTVQTPMAADCAARGGTIMAAGRAQTMQCVVKLADAGRRCTTGSECAGDCRIEEAPFPEAGAAAEGRCQADSRPFGCHASVESGKATPAICID